MGFAARPMDEGDIPQALEVERDAFPTQWPPTPFRRDLQRGNAHHLVVVEEGKLVSANPGPSWWRRLISAWQQLISGDAPALAPRPYIAGFCGLWFVAGEAHLTTIGVREAHRRRGIGELLLIAAIEEAVRRDSRTMTLEVRASNYGAQALYEKYGFRKVGLRHRYYTDNNEDAIIMTTERLTSASYQAQFQRLKRAHSVR